jgi:hypothetical protein
MTVKTDGIIPVENKIDIVGCIDGITNGENGAKY